ncbi:hypothetical protein DF186_21290, partial [Enterococcus hirae]
VPQVGGPEAQAHLARDRQQRVDVDRGLDPAAARAGARGTDDLGGRPVVAVVVGDVDLEDVRVRGVAHHVAVPAPVADGRALG